MMECLTVIISIINVWIAYKVFQFTRKDINSKLYVDSQIRNSNNEFNADINSELLEMDFNKKGFPEIKHDILLWELKIGNNGDFPDTNIQIDYSIIIKKYDFDYGIDKADIKNEKLVSYKTIDRSIKIEYLPPDGKKIINILYLTGEFPSADLRIDKLVSNERTFINKSIHLETYEHPHFSKLEDADDGRKMLGINKPE